MTDLCTHINWQETEAIILDLDGTIYDKHGLGRHLLSRHCGQWRYLIAERRTRKQLQQIHFDSSDAYYEQFFRLMAQKSCSTSNAARQWYFQQYLPSMVEVIEQYCSPRREILDLLQQCHLHRVQVAIFSDYEKAEDKLQVLHLDASQFTAVVSAPQLGGLKPNRLAGLQLLRMFRVSPNRCIWIGDRDDTDGANARSVGCNYLII